MEGTLVWCAHGCATNLLVATESTLVGGGASATNMYRAI